MRTKRTVKTITLSNAKAKFSGLVDEVSRRGHSVTITKNGRPAAVLMSANEYDSRQEDDAVRSDAGLVREIKSGLRVLKAHKARLYTLDELFK